MSGKFNNRTLLLIFLGLAALLVIARFTSIRVPNTTLMTDVAAIDTGQVTGFTLYPRAEEGQRIDFARNGDQWRVSMDDIDAPASLQAIRGILSEISGLEAQQLVSRDPERWDEYQVSDSLGTRVVIREGNREKLDLVVGRFQYQPPPQGNYNMYGQNGVSGKTYIRLHGEKEVYSAEGFFAFSINQAFDRWRDQTVSRINKALLTRLRFDYPADSGFVAQKSENHWLVAGLPADSASMDQYLNRLRNSTHSVFENRDRPAGDPDYQLAMEGDNMSPVVIRAYARQDGTYLLNSSLNPESWFRYGPEQTIKEIFPGSKALLPAGS